MRRGRRLLAVDCVRAEAKIEMGMMGANALGMRRLRQLGDKGVRE